MTRGLHAVRHPGEVSAAQALAWFTGPAAEREVIGYVLAPDRAEWFRCDGSVPHGPTGARDLTGAFELFATGWVRQLRWFHTEDGHGQAVSLAEDLRLLPFGEQLPARPERVRLPGVIRRLLAGEVAESGDAWARLASTRYASCDVPVAAKTGQQVWAELAEYSVADQHGNQSVIDTLMLGLRVRNAVASGAAPGQAEHTT